MRAGWRRRIHGLRTAFRLSKAFRDAVSHEAIDRYQRTLAERVGGPFQDDEVEAIVEGDEVHVRKLTQGTFIPIARACEAWGRRDARRRRRRKK
jgi:hypothetical protein